MFRASEMIYSIISDKAKVVIFSLLLVGIFTMIFSTPHDVTYKDPNDPGNYIVVNKLDHTFIINQDGTDEPVLTGTYTVAHDPISGRSFYNFEFTRGFGQQAEIVDGGNGVKSPAGNVWVKV